MIELKTLDKTFQMIHASDHITATIPDGMAFGLIGSNGAGKKYASAYDIRYSQTGRRRSSH